MTIDGTLQMQVDSQLLEQGAFAALDWLIESGRLAAADYEAWRRKEIDRLDEVLMGSPEKIRSQLESAIAYARSIGLVEQPQIFHAWMVDGAADGEPLCISADPKMQRLIASRHVPGQTAPQLDLFFDNPVVALINGIVRAVSAGNREEAHRQLDGLYAEAPNHADLAAFDRLLAALGHLDSPIVDPRSELKFLLDLEPTAQRLLGSQARDLLAPLWRQLAGALGSLAFCADEPSLHRSFALTQSQDWVGVADSVHSEPRWWLHDALCLRLAHSSFHRQRRAEALLAWFHVCWRSPDEAGDLLDHGQPDSGIAAPWRRFVDCEEDAAADGAAPLSSLTAADFPAWMLLHEPGLAQSLALDSAPGDTPGEEAFRCIHRWIHARRDARHGEEMALRKTLQANHPMLFRILKGCV